jgi:hypothetical protein
MRRSCNVPLASRLEKNIRCRQKYCMKKHKYLEIEPAALSDYRGWITSNGVVGVIRFQEGANPKREP